MVELNYQSKVPIYEQIANGIKFKILNGSFKPNDQMPSIREMASELGVNPNTVKKSYDTLERQNMIQSFSTKGTFITDKIDTILLEIKNDSIDVIRKEIENLKKIGVSREELLEGIEESWKA